MSDPALLQLSCPSGKRFYACDYGTRFLGCCTEEGVDICVNGCRIDFVEAANFNQQYYGNLTRNDCNTTVAAGDWYTCKDTSPPFLGCCASNACMSQGGCPQDQLVPAQLSENVTEIAPFSSVLVRQPTAVKSLTGAIVGGVVGTVVGAILIVLVVWYRIRKLRKSGTQQLNTKNDGNDLNQPETPVTLPLSPASKYDGSTDKKSAPNELQSVSAPVAELASSEISLPVPELPSPDPAPTPPNHSRGSTPNSSGFIPYTIPDDHPLSNSGITFGPGSHGNLATNF